MGLLNKLDKKFRHWGIPHITLYLIFGQVLVYFAYVSGKIDLSRIYLIPENVLKGEVWRQRREFHEDEDGRQRRGQRLDQGAAGNESGSGHHRGDGICIRRGAIAECSHR